MSSENIDQISSDSIDILDDDEEQSVDNEGSFTIPYILQSFFTIISEITADGKTTGKCNLCVKSKIYLGDLKVNSNLTKHLVSHLHNVFYCFSFTDFGSNLF